MPNGWKYALLPTLIVLFLALFPQINIWIEKGSEWNGAYVVSNYDEVAYSAYVNALIEGRARRNDPFIGKDNLDKETLYSIQFIPAYSIALPARFFGFSASTAFIILNFAIAFLSSLAIFFLIRDITGDQLLSAVGVLAVLCLGTAVAFEGELQHKILGNYLCDFFPFLRRYQPGFAFPIFFLFCFFVRRMLTRRGYLYPITSGLTFVVLVFSYFYLWTAALAWLACITALWFVAKADMRRKTLVKTGIVGIFALAAIIPYFLMLANRVENMDGVQLLNLTRAPNLFALPEIFGFLIAVAVLILIRKKRLEFRSPTVLIALSFALTPFILFNQQTITGRSLQPVHYEIFIANYLIMTALILVVWIVKTVYAPVTAEMLGGKSVDACSEELTSNRTPSISLNILLQGARKNNGQKFGDSNRFSRKFGKALIYFAIAAVIWGFIESSATARRNAGFESLRDDAMPVLNYLKKQKQPADASYQTVLSSNLMVADFIPTVTSHRSLWTAHTNSAGGVDAAENRDLFYKYLYYSGYDEKELAQALDEGIFEVKAALFGGGRALPTLESDARPITRAEVDAEIKKYKEFREGFDAADAANPELSYLIVPTLAEPNLEMLDRWYQRDEGKKFGLFKIYKVELKARRKSFTRSIQQLLSPAEVRAAIDAFTNASNKQKNCPLSRISV